MGLAARIERVAAELERTVTPRGIWQVFPVDAQGTNAAGEPCIRLAGTTVELDGRDIFRHLKDAQGCALLAATLGMEANGACARRADKARSTPPCSTPRARPISRLR